MQAHRLMPRSCGSKRRLPYSISCTTDYRMLPDNVAGLKKRYQVDLRLHLLIWPCARKSAMSILQVGQGFMTLRSRMARPVAGAGLPGIATLACITLQAFRQAF